MIVIIVVVVVVVAGAVIVIDVSIGCGIVEYYCFFIIIIVGPPNLPDTAWLLK